MPTATPTSYTELHQLYRPFTEKMVNKWGIYDREEIQDVSSQILTRFLERDMLSEFDPSRNVQFVTFLGAFIGRYIKHLRERSYIERAREISSDVVVGGSAESDRTLYDVVAPQHYDDNTDLEYLEFVRSTRGALGRLPRKNKNDTMDPVAVFDQIVLHEYEYGKIDCPKLAEHFGVSLATAKNWVGRIRAQIKIQLAEHAAA